MILTQLFIAFKLSSENITNTLSKLKRSFIHILNYVDCVESVAGCEAGGNTVRPVSWETVALKQTFFTDFFSYDAFLSKNEGRRNSETEKICRIEQGKCSGGSSSAETGLNVTKNQLSSAGFQNSAFAFLFYNMMPEATAYQNLYEKETITGVVILKSIFERDNSLTQICLNSGMPYRRL